MLHQDRRFSLARPAGDRRSFCFPADQLGPQIENRSTSRWHAAIAYPAVMCVVMSHMPSDHLRNKTDRWLIPFESMQPVPIGCWATRGWLLFPGLASGQITAKADAHRVDISRLKCPTPAAGNGNLAKARAAAIVSLDDTDVIAERCRIERSDGVRMVKIVVVPEADVLPASLADPEISSQRAPLPAGFRPLDIPGSKFVGQPARLRVDAIGYDQVLATKIPQTLVAKLRETTGQLSVSSTGCRDHGQVQFQRIVGRHASNSLRVR